jgi:hypothetical protein
MIIRVTPDKSHVFPIYLRLTDRRTDRQADRQTGRYAKIYTLSFSHFQITDRAGYWVTEPKVCDRPMWQWREK